MSRAVVRPLRPRGFVRPAAAIRAELAALYRRRAEVGLDPRGRLALELRAQRLEDELHVAVWRERRA